MTDEEKRMQLKRAETGQGNTVAVDAMFLLKNRFDFQANKIPVYRIIKTADGKLEVLPVRYEWIEALSVNARNLKQFVVPKDWESRIPPPSEDPLVGKVQEQLARAPEERAREVAAIRHTLDDLKRSDAHPVAKAKAIMEAVEEVFTINKASLKLNRSDVTVNERTVAGETQGVVSAVLGMVESSDTVHSLFEAFKSLSNGQTLNHISRVFTTMTAFLHFFNKMHQLRAGQGLRLIFNEQYGDYYRQILPELKPHLFNADNIIQMPSINPPELKKYALGAFLHDIGKLGNLDYFESDASYSATEVRQHVFLSSGLILMNYGIDHEEARLMAGDHHNALFHKDGYGVSRLEREKGIRKPLEVERCIGASADDFIAGRALGFLPTEMLAIVDIYDAMIDASRTYKKAMSPEEAIAFMEEKPVASGKLDPVLFDIFIDFLHEQKAPIPEDTGLMFKIRSRHKL